MDLFTSACGTRTEQSEPDFDFKEIVVPVLIVGAGAAGVRTAIELADHGVEPLVLGKRDHGDAHTMWAAGGINAALGTHDPEDSWEVHAADTYKEGQFINDSTAVELVTASMPDRIRELDKWGMGFDRTDEKEIDQRYFGAQAYRRTCFVGDRTGEALLDTLVEQAQDHNVPYRENVLITSLISDGDRVYGAVGVDMDDGQFLVFVAEHFVLAAGGYAALYDRHTSRDDENTADGVALAHDAGATLMDMEMVQFHPTGMIGREDWDDDWDGRLVTEAVRGEGGRLYNANDERFMERYSPEQMELDARDMVARAIATEIEEGRGTDRGGVYLDISHKDRAYIEGRLPRIYERFKGLGIDMAEEPVEVAPTTHYAMGGVDIDFATGATGVDRLYVVGETTAGVHGANRLGGNSLAETVAVGTIVGQHIATRLGDTDPTLPDSMRTQAERQLGNLLELETADGDVAPKMLIDELRTVLANHAGILRDGEQLAEGLSELGRLHGRADELGIDGDRTSRDFEFAVDLSFMFTAAEALLRSARLRVESRGAHYRTDYEDTDDEWRQNVLVRQNDEEMKLGTRAAEQPSNAVQKMINEDHELDYHHLE